MPMAPEFTAEQLEAIRYLEKDACVVAGPGSGKTTVLVERYSRLILDHKFDTGEILAITFTEKAAANMKAKLADKFRYNVERLRDIESAWVSTIHGFCARLLRENAIAAGIDPRFAVLDARESDDLQFECLNRALDELVAERREEALALIATLQTPWIAGDLKSAYDGIRSAGKTIEEVRAMPSPGGALSAADAALRLREILLSYPPRPQLTDARRRHLDEVLEWWQIFAAVDGYDVLLRTIDACPINLGRVPESVKPALREFRDTILPAIGAAALDAHTAPFRQIVFDVLAHFDVLYNRHKTERAALDFNDLERRAIELLEKNPEVRDGIRTRFRQIMLDEFQDINQQQAKLIRLIRGDDVFFAVGDRNQSIYGFRHARPDIFDDYRAEIEAAEKQSVSLFHNFRSREGILRCVEALLNPAEGIEARELHAARAFDEAAEAPIEIIRAVDEDKDEACNREARWIAHRILELRAASAARDFRDFAVLCRNRDSMDPILAAFDRARIPYVCGRRQSFLLSREGFDITALLRIVANPRDGIALATVLRSTLVGIGDEALLRLRLLGSSITAGLNVVAYDHAKYDGFSDDDRRKLERFTENLKRWRADRQIVPLDVLIGRALSDCGVAWEPGSVAGANIEAFLDLARTRGAERSLLDFLRELESIENAFSTESDLSDEDQGNAVQVMTAHAAKGLEFPVTIIAAMDKGTQRSSAAITFTPEHGLGIKWKDPFSKDGAKDSWALANAERLKKRESDEADRLLYVAMTRAEDRLILTYSCGRWRPSNWAKGIDEFFGLAQRPASNEVRREMRDGFEVSVRVTDADPPELSADTLDAFEAPVLGRPAMADQSESAVNVTSLAVFAGCPRKYYLQRYIGWNSGRFARFDPEDLPEDDGDELSAADMGSLVHEVLAGKPGPFPDEARELASVFLASDLGRRAAAAMRAAREWDFIVDIDGTLLRGTVDLWFEENGEVHVVDYKTDAIARPDEYAPQLALYALALERALGKRPSGAWLHFLRPDVLAPVVLDDAALENARRLIASLREAQNELRFDLNEAGHCQSCQFYRSLCPAGT